MSLSKVNFAGRSLEVFTVVDSKGEKWHQANPFADALGYNNKSYASTRVRRKSKIIWKPKNRSPEEGAPNQCMSHRLYRATCSRIQSLSTRPACSSGSTLLRCRLRSGFGRGTTTTCCRRCVTRASTTWRKMRPPTSLWGWSTKSPLLLNDVFLLFSKHLTSCSAGVYMKTKLMMPLTVALKDSNDKLHEANLSIVTMSNNVMKAFEIVNEARKDCEMARKETADLANRMADIAQDVIAKPSDPQLLHSLAVCAMGGDQYAFLRPQKRSLKRSLERLSVGEKDIVFRRDYVPNSINVLNKVKERLPKDKYKAHNNRITLHDDLTKEDLLEAIESTVTSRQVAIIVNKANTTTNKNA
uniref:BRO-A n=1 Tax=Chrysodeixis includens nucleopolyhedrovirus TaxID=1207438 RepID=A0A6B9CP44_9ABAC|nr:BRO-A [Chrysodeixis includens nucleopolyhedrovirus]